jgi:hypothetical protein
MPILDTDMSDLDVRDAQNRPVISAAARQGLSALFMDNLFNLTVVYSLHGIRQAISDVEILSRLFRDLIYNVACTLARALPSALKPPSKRFVHNVHNLWTTFVVGVFLAILMSAKLLAKPAPHTCQIRC